MKRTRSMGTVFALAAALSLGACESSTTPMEAVSPDEGHEVGAATMSAQSMMPTHCPPLNRLRTATEVLADHRAAVAAADYDAAVCNYAPDATVIGDGGVDRGHEQIRSSLQFFNAIYGGTQPQVIQEIALEISPDGTEMVRLRFTVDTECIAVPDGIDTYFIRGGLIRGQTSHGFPVFQCF